MPTIEVKLPNGLEIRAEGDESVFDRVSALLKELRGANLEGAPSDPPDPDHGTNGGPGETPLDVQELAARLTKVGATTDIERIAVLAQAAAEAGMEGLDYATVDRLFEELGQPKPPRWAKTFSNAKQRNYIRNVGRGLWLPTVVGENFARYGKEGVRRRALNAERPSPVPDDPEGG